MPHTSGNILLHFIFSTKGRHPLIKAEFRADLFAYLGGIVREMDGTALIVNGTSDHVHMLARVRTAHSPSELEWPKPTRRAGFTESGIRISLGKPALPQLEMEKAFVR
jgi:REP element-mobilizing transposase RayT